MCVSWCVLTVIATKSRIDFKLFSFLSFSKRQQKRTFNEVLFKIKAEKYNRFGEDK